MTELKIDPLNTFLILLSLGLAYAFPFELFIIVYAILGPLHYLTEINWIRDKKYFINNTFWIFIATFLSLAIAIRIILKLPSVNQASSLFNNISLLFLQHSNSLFFIALVFAGTFLFIKKTKYQIISISVGILLMLLLNQFTIYHVIIGVFLPTLIHVYLFTILFMWYGTLQTKSTVGNFNILLLASIPFILYILEIDTSSYHFSENFKTIFIENNFQLLNVSISKLLGLTDGKSFFFYESADLKIQIFIAFAYTYHYLNWFSKTTVIGWHKKLTRKKSIFISGTWLVSVGIYFYNYTVGISLLLFLSVLHVIMEFPLNLISIKKIINHKI